MILSSHGIIGSSIGQVDADYQAVLDYATTQGYTLPSAAQRLLQEQLVIDLKDGGIWDKLDIFYVFATNGDSDFASINWKDPNNFEITEVNSPNFTSNLGFEGDGTSAYLDTNYSLNTNWINASQDSATAFAYHYADASPQNNFSAISFSSANLLINPRNPSNNYALRNNASGLQSGLFISVVNLHSISRTSSSGYDYYIDGILQTSFTSTSNSVLSTEIQLFASPAANIYSNGKASNLGYGAGLDATENDDLSTAWFNYFNAI
jgi:hypothetical protein